MRNQNRFFQVIILAVIMAAVFLTEFSPIVITPVLAQDNNEPTKDEEKKIDDHGEEGIVKLSEEEMKEFGIDVKTAVSGNLQIEVELAGEIALNTDRLAHIVPRVGGIVREVRKTLGDYVNTGDVMAVLDSRDLADAKSGYLSAIERETLAKANFNREKALWKKKVSSEKEYLEAKQNLAEMQIMLRSAEQKLHAFGFSESYVKKLPDHPDMTFIRYELVAPFSGTVIEKHISMGEVVRDDTGAFVIADLSTVWVDLNVYQKDLPNIRKGQPVTIISGPGIPDSNGEIVYLGPVVGENTRTVLARVALPNPDGLLRPGLFITGKVTVSERKVPLLVRKTAIQRIEGKPVIFIQDEDGLEPREVVIGQSDALNAEIISGISPGQRYVAKGAFTLKSQLAKGSLDSGHNH